LLQRTLLHLFVGDLVVLGDVFESRVLDDQRLYGWSVSDGTSNDVAAYNRELHHEEEAEGHVFVGDRKEPEQVLEEETHHAKHE
jgi:hypothetical protein